jgi:hypothetical protein
VAKAKKRKRSSSTGGTSKKATPKAKKAKKAKKRKSKKATPKAKKALGRKTGTGRKRKKSEEEEEEEVAQEKEKEKEKCTWIVPFPMQIANSSVEEWHASLGGDENIFDVAPNMVFECMVNAEKSYDSAAKALQRRVAVLEKVTTLAKSGAGSHPSCSLAFMCHDASQMWNIAAVLLLEGYSVDPPLVGTRPSSVPGTVYIVIARKPAGRRRTGQSSSAGAHWTKQFPQNLQSTFQYNEKMSYLSLQEQTAIWFLASNAGSKDDVVWQFNASHFPFFSEAAIAMGLHVRMLYDKDSDCKKMKMVTELAYAFAAQEDSFRLYDQAQKALTILALCGLSSGVIDDCSSTQNHSHDEQSDSASQPSFHLQRPRVTMLSTGWFMQGVTGIQGDSLQLLEEADKNGTFWNEATIV